MTLHPAGLIGFLLRPVARGPRRRRARDAVVRILVDTSRSMSIEDADGGARRIDRARAYSSNGCCRPRRAVSRGGAWFRREPVAVRRPPHCVLLPGEATLRVRLPACAIVIGAGLSPASSSCQTAATRERGWRARGGGWPGVRRRRRRMPVKDRENVSVTAGGGDPGRLACGPGGLGSESRPRQRRSIAPSRSGRPIDVRRVTPAADGSPVRAVFQVSPGRGVPTVYTVETPVTTTSSCPTTRAARSFNRPRARARAARRRRPRVRAQLSQARVGVRPRPRDRFSRTEGPERARRRHLLHPGGAVSQRQLGLWISRHARGRVRRARARQRQGHRSRARSSTRRGALSASAAAACWCSDAYARALPLYTLEGVCCA